MILILGNEFCLQMRFIDHIYDDQVIDHATVKIVLPEGVTDVRLETPFEVVRDSDEVMKFFSHCNNLMFKFI